jgi:hypothetical protein
MLSPLDPPSRYDFWQWTTAFCILPWTFDLPLLLRVWAVYPPRTTTRTFTISIFAFPVLVKLTRLAVLIVFAARWKVDVNKNSDIFLAAEITLKKYPLSKVEWVLQILDNTYVSAIFLYRLRGRAIGVPSAHSTSAFLPLVLP